ncbi:MAG: LysM peptidoglycan-binding domain-containing protein [Gaiellaceae bacterium]
MFALRSLLVLCGLTGALLLAVARPSSGSAQEERYVVRAGDTLWELAVERYGGDPREGVWEIRERNGLPGAGPFVGMILYLPAEAGGGMHR